MSDEMQEVGEKIVARLASVDRTCGAMEQLGWDYNAASNGFTRDAGEGRDPFWVSYEQAESCLDAAERGELVRPRPVSRTVAEIVVPAVNAA